MVIIPRKLNMDHLRFHLISELGKKMERMESMNPVEPRGDEGSVVVLPVHQRKDIRRKL
jgi:hypothetical protein